MPLPPPPPPLLSSEEINALKPVAAMKYYYQYNPNDIDLKSLTEYPSDDEYNGIFTRHPSEMSETGTWMKDLESFNLSLEDTHPIIVPPPPPAPPIVEMPKLDTLN